MKNHPLTPFARQLRKQSTHTENLLWKQLRAKRFSNLKWRRQQALGNYIVDFICHEKKLIIECDGGQHDEQVSYDQKRDRWLQDQGYRVLRFWNNEILGDIETVLQIIFRACRLNEENTER